MIHLQPHQTEGAMVLFNSKNMLLADEMGLGKTYTALAAARMFTEAGEVDCILVIAPASLLTNWKEEMEAAYGFSPVVFHGNRRKRNFVLHRAYITSFDTFMADFRFLQEGLVGYRVCVIVDEAHNIKNPETKRARSIYHWPAERRIAITGTPINNRIEDLFGILYWINPDVTGDRDTWHREYLVKSFNQIQFRNKKTGKYQEYWVEQVVGYKNLDKLNMVLDSIMLRRKKADVLTLPKKTVVYTPYEPDDKLYANVLDQVDLDEESLMVKILRLQEALSGLHPYDGGKKKFTPGKKFNLLDDLIKGRTGRIVVWFKYTQTLHNIKELWKNEKIYTHTGEQSTNQKQQAIDAWKKDENGILLATIRSAGVGLNLVEASSAIFYEMELSPSANCQAEDRLDRIGQTLPVDIRYLYGKGTVEEGIINLLRKKEKAINAVVDSFTQEELKQIYESTLQFRL